MQNLTRRTFAKFSFTAAATALGLVLTITGLAATDTKSENKIHAVFYRGPQDEEGLNL